MAAKAHIGRRAVRAALDAAARRLLDERTPDGHWRGELSDSALSTATATFALALSGAGAHADLVRRGLDWLADHQNDDGGWGDTVRSHSNLSTTALGWSALAGAPRPAERHVRAGTAAEGYIADHCGSIDAEDVARAVADRYGRDRSFSAPILTMCALAGRLGEGADAWRHVAQLPFELAAVPHGLLKALRLPVVSYALPALIAIGQARHAHRPTRNGLARLARRLVRRRTLRLLAEIQPDSGGFLEAAPLTSFVLMSLVSLRPPTPAGAGHAPGPPGGAPGAAIVDRAAAFLRASARPGGAWPIDTDLATWVTTLAVNALPGGALGLEGRRAIRRWLLDQQHTVEHPYTRAAPGGWAWTDLSGGVPDADDTAGALRALRRLGPPDEPTERAAVAGCKWLLDLQNRDGGIPTFCRGWGHLPFDRSCPDLTAHALLAWSAWRAELPGALPAEIHAAMRRAVDGLLDGQGTDGQWLPLWFGNQDAPGQGNPIYGTARVLTALGELWPHARRRLAGPIRRGVAYLLSARGSDGGWGGAPGVRPSIEETALAVEALAAVATPGAADGPGLPAGAVLEAVRAGAAWLVQHTCGGTDFPAAPIGLYFARLWYFEKLYPLVFTVSALRRAGEVLGP